MTPEQREAGCKCETRLGLLMNADCPLHSTQATRAGQMTPARLEEIEGTLAGPHTPQYMVRELIDLVATLNERLWQAEQRTNAFARRLASATSMFRTLQRYRAVQGRLCDSENELVGLAYDGSIWGPSANPKYDMFELAEAVETWLQAKCAEALKELE